MKAFTFYIGRMAEHVQLMEHHIVVTVNLATNRLFVRNRPIHAPIIHAKMAELASMWPLADTSASALPHFKERFAKRVSEAAVVYSAIHKVCYDTPYRMYTNTIPVARG